MNRMNVLKDDAAAYIASKYGQPAREFLLVSVGEQKLYHIKDQDVIKTYIVSTSEYGTGSENGSKQTPFGLHKVKEKHGDNVPSCGKLIGRVFNGEIATVYRDQRRSGEDDILSRLLWLEGLEEGSNQGAGVDSYERYIYIHGTSEEGRLGTPSSHGCIRMSNKDVVELYPQIQIGTLVLIL